MGAHKLCQLQPLVRVVVLAALPAGAQQGAASGEWRYYGGDSGTTKYSPLDQIDATTVKNLRIAWQWHSDNFGRRPESNCEVTPFMADGVLYFTASSRRDAVAVDAASGETLRMYRLDEGARGNRVARANNRGLAYWSDGKGDSHILLISPGCQLIALDAKTGRVIPAFGTNGIIDLTQGLDRDAVKPGIVDASSPAIVVRDTVVVGAALLAGTAPPSKGNVSGYIRGFGVRTGKKLWTFHTVEPGKPGNETWDNESWKYTGNTGAWVPFSADNELGCVYLPIEMPTGDFYGGRTGKMIRYYQTVHHDIRDRDIAAPPILLDIIVDGRKIKAVAQPTRQAYTYVFDRTNGKPVSPIVERPVPQSDAPGEKASPTQPIPTKPPAVDRRGSTLDDLFHAGAES